MLDTIAHETPEAQDALFATVIAVFRRHTGYDLEAIRPGLHFERDLGVDPMTLDAILTDICKACGLSSGAVPAGLGTLDALVAHLRERHDGERFRREDEVRAATLAAFRRHSGYGEDRLGPEVGIESDLGVDSVTLLAILDDAARTLGLEKPFFRPGLATVGAVIAHIAEAAAAAPRRSDPVAAEAPAAPPASPSGALAAEVFGNPLLSGLTFPVIGFERQDIDSLHDALRQEHALPEALRLADCDTHEKLARYVHAAEPHGVETLAAGDARPIPAAPPPGHGRDPRTMKDFVASASRDLFHKAREFRKFYRRRQQEQLYWHDMPLESRCANRAVIHDAITGRRREFLMFASGNHLGLANHPEVIEAIAGAARRYGAASAGSRLSCGSTTLHKALEARLARLKGRPACIVYPSGYAAHLGSIPALAGPGDLVFSDALNPVSLQEGRRLSGAAGAIYRHDLGDLEDMLRQCDGHDGGRLIVTDGVFGMHGDVVDLPRLMGLARRYGAHVLVDDAHATGVLGRTGAGTAEHFGMAGEPDLESGSLSNALAGLGGFVAGEEDVIEYLRFYSNTYAFAAPIPAAVAAGVIAALDVMEREPQRLSRLWSNIHRLRGHLLGAGFDLERSNSAILPVVTRDDRKTLEFGRAARARGLFCQTVVHPDVAAGDARLRLGVSSEHTAEDLDLAAAILCDAARDAGLPVAS